MAFIALFIALGYVLSLPFFEFPVFPLTPHLKLGFAFSAVLIGSYMLGALSGEIIIFAIELITGLTTGDYVGALANFLMANCFVVLPAVIYKWRKGLKHVIITLVICTFIETVVALLANAFVLLPFYTGSFNVATETFKSTWIFIALFNVIKCVSNGVITVLLYKRLKNLLNKFFVKR